MEMPRRRLWRRRQRRSLSGRRFNVAVCVSILVLY